MKCSLSCLHQRVLLFISCFLPNHWSVIVIGCFFVLLSTKPVPWVVSFWAKQASQSSCGKCWVKIKQEAFFPTPSGCSSNLWHKQSVWSLCPPTGPPTGIWFCLVLTSSSILCTAIIHWSECDTGLTNTWLLLNFWHNLLQGRERFKLWMLRDKKCVKEMNFESSWAFIYFLL